MTRRVRAPWLQRSFPHGPFCQEYARNREKPKRFHRLLMPPLPETPLFPGLHFRPQGSPGCHHELTQRERELHEPLAPREQGHLLAGKLPCRDPCRGEGTRRQERLASRPEWVREGLQRRFARLKSVVHGSWLTLELPLRSLDGATMLSPAPGRTSVPREMRAPVARALSGGALEPREDPSIRGHGPILRASACPTGHARRGQKASRSHGIPPVMTLLRAVHARRPLWRAPLLEPRPS